MKANVQIEAVNAVGGKVSIDMSIHVEAPISSDAKGMVKGLVDAMLVSEDVMSIFGLRACVREYILECRGVDDERCYEVGVKAEEKRMLTCRRPMIRPDEKKPDDSTRLNIRVQFEKGDD